MAQRCSQLLLKKRFDGKRSPHRRAYTVAVKSKRPRAKKSFKKKNLEKIPIALPAARDEGPRLIPLSPKRLDEGHFQRILELADIILKPKGRY
jgi:hypothetical protein